MELKTTPPSPALNQSPSLPQFEDGRSPITPEQVYQRYNDTYFPWKVSHTIREHNPDNREFTIEDEVNLICDQIPSNYQATAKQAIYQAFEIGSEIYQICTQNQEFKPAYHANTPIGTDYSKLTHAGHGETAALAFARAYLGQTDEEASDFNYSDFATGLLVSCTHEYQDWYQAGDQQTEDIVSSLVTNYLNQHSGLEADSKDPLNLYQALLKLNSFTKDLISLDIRKSSTIRDFINQIPDLYQSYFDEDINRLKKFGLSLVASDWEQTLSSSYFHTFSRNIYSGPIPTALVVLAQEITHLRPNAINSLKGFYDIDGTVNFHLVGSFSGYDPAFFLSQKDRIDNSYTLQQSFYSKSNTGQSLQLENVKHKIANIIKPNPPNQS